MLFKSGGVNWIVVFLGNPGPKYANTRHNAGFMTADVLEKKTKAKLNRLRFNAMTSVVPYEGQKLLLMKPRTFMNLSGDAVGPAAAYYKVPSDRVIVVCDDTSLPQGRLRIRKKGSSGGHNGLKSIIAALGTEDFPRIRIGVGAPPPKDEGGEMIDWVLGEFKGKDAGEIAESCEKACDALLTYITQGPDRAMNKFN